MSSRSFPVLTVLGLSAILWVVPSIGSQGMGTIGERFAHADRTLVETGHDARQTRLALQAADAQVEAALAR